MTESVLMLGWELPPYNTGGLGVACYGMTKGLASLGVRLAFALPRPLPVGTEFMEIMPYDMPGVSFHALNGRMFEYPVYANQYEKHFRQSSRFDMGTSQEIYEEAFKYAEIASRWSKNLSHRIVHAHDWMTYPAGMRIQTETGKPLVVHIHATEFDRTGGSVDQRIADLEYQGLTAAKKVIAVSNYTKRVIMDKYAIPEDRIAVVHNGVDANEFDIENFRRVFPNDQVVLYVGRLTFQKGVDYFIHAAKRLLSTHPKTVFVIAGTGDMERQLIMQAAALGIGNRVIFTGFLNGKPLQRLYSMADAFVMPSVSEPYGIVALEAAAAKVPMIISKQSGVSETLSNVYLSDFWDIDLMVAQLKRMLSYPKLHQDRALLAQIEAKKMTWTKSAREIMSIYQQI